MHLHNLPVTHRPNRPGNRGGDRDKGCHGAHEARRGSRRQTGIDAVAVGINLRGLQGQLQRRGGEFREREGCAGDG